MLNKHKYQKAFQICEEYIAQYEHPYLSMSWGKDSILLLYILQQVKKDIKVIFLNSGYALPDTYEIRDKLVDEWDINYEEIQQDVDYIEMCQLIGLPHERTASQQNKVITNIKKITLDDYAKKKGYDLCFWGIRADEAKKRQWLFKKNGYSVKTNDILKVHPIIHFTLSDVWEFYYFLDIPVNQIYTKNKFLKKEQIRNTGWVSTDGADSGKIMWLKYYYPEYYNQLQAKFPQIRAFV